MIGDEPNNSNPLQKLRAALHAKAKNAPNFRFYSLYDKVYRRDVLQAAWEQCRANGGAPGVDRQTFRDIQEYGLERWLDELTEELRTTRNKDTHRGTPQGAPISPLLANLYMRRFVLGWKTLGYEKRFQARIVNYADDFVILCRSRADAALTAMRDMMSRLKLTVNETKTHVCRLPAESFDFLGYTFGRMYSPRNGKAYPGVRPAKKKVLGICRELNEVAAKVPTFARPEALVHQMNQKIRGWANYFSYGTFTPAYRIVHQHAVHRVRRWLRRKFELSGLGYRQFPIGYPEETLGLLNPLDLPRRFSWANA